MLLFSEKGQNYCELYHLMMILSINIVYSTLFEIVSFHLISIILVLLDPVLL